MRLEEWPGLPPRRALHAGRDWRIVLTGLPHAVDNRGMGLEASAEVLNSHGQGQVMVLPGLGNSCIEAAFKNLEQCHAMALASAAIHVSMTCPIGWTVNLVAPARFAWTGHRSATWIEVGAALGLLNYPQHERPETVSLYPLRRCVRRAQAIPPAS